MKSERRRRKIGYVQLYPPMFSLEKGSLRFAKSFEVERRRSRRPGRDCEYAEEGQRDTRDMHMYGSQIETNTILRPFDDRSSHVRGGSR